MSFVFLGVVSVVMAIVVAASFVPYCRNPKQSDIEPE